jgi:hypothetical protein
LLAQAAARDGLLAEKQPAALAATAFTGLAELDGDAKRDAAKRKRKKSSTVK